MSTPINPLSLYRSYSYYHVLVLSDSIDTAESLCNKTNQSVWEHIDASSPNASTKLGKYSPKTAPNGGMYCVLINGATDAQYSITSFKYNTLTSANIFPGVASNSVALEGSITISEPKGVMFLNRIVDACNAMGIDASVAVWVNKTFFVGYTQDDQLTTISDVAPLMFHALDVVGNFSEQGGIYDLQILGISHGMTRLPQYSRIPQAVNYVTANTLKQAVQNLEDAINQQMSRYFACVYDTVSKISSDTATSLTQIYYKIKLNEPYNSDHYTVTDSLPQAKTVFSCSSPSPATVSKDQSIEEGINFLLNLSPEIKLEAKQGVQGKKYYHRIRTTAKDEDVGGRTVRTVYYVIDRIPDAKSYTIEDIMNNRVDDQRLGKNLISFDYIYTGRNIDILEFDIKMSLGLAYLMSATSHNSYNPQNGVADVGIEVSNNDVLQGVPTRYSKGKIAKSIPVGFGTQVKRSGVSNTPNLSNSMSSQYTMRKAASFEAIDTSMVIIGNPNLLSSVNKNAIPTNVIGEDITEQVTSGAFPDWGLIPSLAKVRIKMPRNNDDLALFRGDVSGKGEAGGTSTDYAIDFWFDGYYYVIGVEHIFTDGQFTQRLEMLGIPNTNFDELFGTDQQQASKAALDTLLSDANYLVGKCYENVFPCKDLVNSERIVLPEPRLFTDIAKTGGLADKITQEAKDIQEQYKLSQNIPLVPEEDTTTKLREQIVDQANYDSIQGWKTADPTVKKAINDAAQAADLTPSQKFLMINMMSQESGFNPNAVNTDSKATGLGQFLKPAWDTYGTGPYSNRTDPYLNSLATAKYLKASESYLTKRLGRSPTKEEMYLAHWRGQAGAAGIIERSEAGKATAADKEKMSLAAHHLNQRVKGTSIPYQPHANVAPSQQGSGASTARDAGAIDRWAAKNKDIIAKFRDCIAESQKQEANKPSENCTPSAPTDNPTTTAPKPTVSSLPTPKTSGDVPIKDF